VRLEEEERVAKIRVAIVGVGNCASSLVQGVEFYRRASGHSAIPGVMHLELGGYHIGDVEFVAAFDVAAGKVGCDSYLRRSEQHRAVFERPRHRGGSPPRPDL
jgi:myo-inositol-1-phosphate synthase